MSQNLPLLFITLSALALLTSVTCLWLSLRSLLGESTSDVMLDSDASRRRDDLLIEKEAVLRSIKDLEFERAVGKISDSDFERLDAQFRARAKTILRELAQDLASHRDKAEALLSAPRGDLR